MKTTKPKLPSPLTAENVYLLPEPEHLKPTDLKKLSADERDIVSEEFLHRLQLLKGQARDVYQQRVSLLLADDINKQLWETNHAIITQAISTLIRINGAVPTKTQLCAETGLSRQTIYRHLKNYNMSVHYKNQVQQLQFLSSHLLAQLAQRAMEGDLKAMRLYFTLTGHLQNTKNPNTEFIPVPESSKYVTTNNRTISQEDLDKVDENGKQAIEDILHEYSPTDVIFVPNSLHMSEQEIFQKALELKLQRDRRYRKAPPPVMA